ncbi:FAD/NAD(P)-binding oxidoreductase [Rubrivivax gelatinosus]|uniref:2Fe-2S iron-sulfur cluster-binding protein n=1 Tax=Rubrivivax gelatinosus TaxID=28068 RepID=UPI0019040743|nr:2Fe-2S iron-sulfur cluster-binding protein [Rubrivivax gelatinosus]MBK1615937.1 FAD/NAD(P)-binding oxidoreductase [Rubrivivax gelatinosus]
MTALQLFGWIVAAALLQVGAAIVLVWWRKRAAAAGLPALAVGTSALPPDAAWAGWREFRVTRRAYEDGAQTQCSFYLEPLEGGPLPPYLPGRFLTFAVDLPGADGPRTLTRCYSLSDAPDARAYRVTIKRVPPPPGRPELPPGQVSGHFHERVQVGDVLRLRAPSGHFVLDAEESLPVVLIAGGIGITPMLAMLRCSLAAAPQRPVHLFYGVRNGAELAFGADLAALALAHPAFALHRVFSQPAGGDEAGRDYEHTGFVGVELLKRALPHGRHRFFICGPPPMMQALVPALGVWGVPPEDVRYEAFGPASMAAPVQVPAAPLAIEVSFRRSGRTLVWDGRDATLLDFAERNGVKVESGCRSGGCGACETRVASGSVQYAHQPDHDVAPGHCLLCVGKPTSALVLEA